MSMLPTMPTDAQIDSWFAADEQDDLIPYSVMARRFARGGAQLLPQQREKLATVYRYAGVPFGQPLTQAQHLAGYRGAWAEWLTGNASGPSSSYLWIAAALALVFVLRR